ncbi:AlpA family transcriptional regulator [Loktanella salsilacus]|uniref:AlpA family transcriptional regulator n=1 Tax=Loktanella salsilacus TaxID=195913 RepID=UPI0030F5855C
MRFLRRNEVEIRTGLSRSSIYSHMSKGTFPKSIKIGIRAVGWVEGDIDHWMQARISGDDHCR